MLIQLPSGSQDQPGSPEGEDCTTFEAGLRRDLASAPLVSYDAVLGGLSKRIVDLVITGASAPLWAPVMLAAAAWGKLSHRGQVFQTHERVGYGGRAFQCRTLMIAQPTATIERLRLPGEPDADPANDQSVAERAKQWRAKWRRGFERMPQLINVLAGDMSLVGPAPLTQDQVEPLKSARRYYLSARPGVVGVSGLVASDQDLSTQYKTYKMSWAVSTDVLIFWDALRTVRRRDELWRPGQRQPRAGAATSLPPVIVRRRSSGGDAA